MFKPEQTYIQVICVVGGNLTFVIFQPFIIMADSHLVGICWAVMTMAAEEREKWMMIIMIVLIITEIMIIQT